METPTITVPVSSPGKPCIESLDYENNYNYLIELIVSAAVAGLICFSLRHSLVNATNKNLSLSRRISWTIAMPSSIAIGNAVIWGALIHKKSDVRVNKILITYAYLIAATTGAVFCLKKVFGKENKLWVRAISLPGLPVVIAGSIFIGIKILDIENDIANKKAENMLYEQGTPAYEKSELYNYKILRLCSPSTRYFIYRNMPQKEWDSIKNELWPLERWEAKRYLPFS